jgi:hypothetical protein
MLCKNEYMAGNLDGRVLSSTWVRPSFFACRTMFSYSLVQTPCFLKSGLTPTSQIFRSPFSTTSHTAYPTTCVSDLQTTKYPPAPIRRNHSFLLLKRVCPPSSNTSLCSARASLTLSRSLLISNSVAFISKEYNKRTLATSATKSSKNSARSLWTRLRSVSGNS